jgi:histidinol phosphatase-like enzyme (inositol monophosphatase family)
MIGRNTLPVAELWRTAHALADAARPVTLQHFRSPALDVNSKNAELFDPVTVADHAAEAAIRSTLARLRPQDGILGEEQGLQPGDGGLTWIVDPIDGTRGYLSGTPTWGVRIALSDAAGPILGVIDQPYIGERFWGGLGEAGFAGPHGRAALATRAARPLEQAVLFSTFPEIGTPDEMAAFGRVRDRVRLVRYGMDCYAYALLAAGQIDLVIEAGLQAYDIAAPIAVIEAAGGIVTDWQGRPAQGGGRVLAAANRQILDAALALLGA